MWLTGPNALESKPSVLPDRATTPCPTDDVLGALVHHALDHDEATRVTSHVDDCATCQELVIAVVRSTERPASGEHDPAAARLLPHTATTTRIGRYELRAVLGAGGMGAVYDAYDTELDRAVALKVLRPDLSASPGLADRLVEESRLMAKVAHPSVIAVYNVGREGGAVYIAMELVRGTTLTAWLRSHALGWRDIVSLFERAGQGLAAAHAAGIVHRDFKPDNVLVGSDGDKVVVTDFGIARETARNTSSDLVLATLPSPGALASGAVLGTPAYMAPEQISGRQVGRRADVFAFSVSLWEALFGARPFPGKTIIEIFKAMHRPPVRPPAGARRVPRRLVRVLERGLALEPRARWRDVPAMLTALAEVRTRSQRVTRVSAGAGLVALGIAAALVVARPGAPIDRCARAEAGLDDAYNPRLDAQIGAALAGTPALLGAVRGRLAATTAAWRQTHRGSCRADRDPSQDARTTACLDARRLELAGAVEDLVAGGTAGAPYARWLSELPGAPAACATPAPGLLFSRVPTDRALRRQVTALRERLIDADTARDHGEFPHALALAQQVATAAVAVWPPLYAEAAFAMGKIQRQGGDSNLALVTLRDAAVAAERAHHDDVAAHSWLELALAAAFDQGDPARALEYVAYAGAAADRIGRPDAVMARLGYIKGVALIAAGRAKEAAGVVAEAVALARHTSADDLAHALQGLGLFYEDQGRYAEAVDAYRDAIAQLPRSPSGQIIGPPTFFERLAVNLAHLGQLAQAEIEARHAVEIAERTLPETQVERSNTHVQLALILEDAGRLDQALAEITGALAAILKIQGARSPRYGAVIGMQGDILARLGHHAEAEPLLARSCEIAAFATGDDGPSYAACQVVHGAALAMLHRGPEALATLDRSIAALTRTYGDAHPQVADAIVQRGTAHATLGQRTAAVADFERAIAIFAANQLDPGYLADAKWRLGKALEAAQPARARAEIVDALKLFQAATGPWAKQRREAAAWLEDHDAGKHRQSS